MKFKASALSGEFLGDQVDPRIRAIIRELDWQTTRKFNYELILTDVLRGQSEEEKLNPHVKLSPHVDRPCRAVDFRNSDMTPEQRQFIKDFVAKWWPQAVLLENDRGDSSPHFHCAVRKG